MLNLVCNYLLIIAMAVDAEHIDLDNAEFQNAWSLVRDTHRSVFLTGKAGTGKSTFLKWICEHTKKQYVVLAPTGIAAVNVGGQTLHSFFKIPLKPLVPGDVDFSPHNIRQTLRYTKNKIKTIRSLELIIIDEISMVRADVIDFIDQVLRIFSGNMREPFGGKQLLLVGDIFQLEPVVTANDKQILGRWYRQYFFFNARVFGQLSLVPIELRKIYRQTDSQFIAMLDRVRVNQASPMDMGAINSRCNPRYKSGDGFEMTLATRRDTVDSINDEHMRALQSKEYTYEGEITDIFPDNDLPTLKELTLKVGAQVIFIRNDKENRWVNGTIAHVSELTDDSVEVATENGDCYRLEPEMWENVQYSYDEKAQKVVGVVKGTFKQYPIKPAWALTVHKSQGLTFGKVVIDFAGGAFSSGQAYVALSRCTSLEGITLLRPLQQRDIIVNPAVVQFSRQFNDQRAISGALEHEKAARLYKEASRAFDQGRWADCVKAFGQAKVIDDVTGKPDVQRLVAVKLARMSGLRREVEQLREALDAQTQLLHKLALEYAAMGDQSQGYGDLAGEDEVQYGQKRPVRLDEVAFKSAMANYNKALRLWPECTAAMLGKGRLLMTIGELDAAEEELNKALATGQDDYEAHMALGELYGLQKNVPNAIMSYKQAAKKDRKAPQPHEALAAIYEALELTDLAEAQQEQAKKLRKRHRRKAP